MEHPENDPTATEPDDIAEPSPEVEQTLPREEPPAVEQDPDPKDDEDDN